MAISAFRATEPAREQSRLGRLTKFLRRRFLGNARRNAGGFVLVGIIVTTVAAMTITLFGVGVVSRGLNLQDGAIWFWDGGRGEAVRVNASAGQIDLRRSLTDAKGHRVKVVQTDRHVLLQDLDAGTVTSLDLATLGVSGVVTTQRPADMRIGLFAGSTLMVDAANGLVSQLDAGNFKPSGQSVKTPKNLVGGDFDDQGRFWVGSPDTGQAISIKLGSIGKGPSIERKVNVGHKGHPWAVSVLDDGVAIVDRLSTELIAVNGEGVVSKTTIPPAGEAATMPVRVRGDVIPITNAGDRNVIVVHGSDVSSGNVAKGVTARSVSVPGSGQKLGTAVAFSDRLYIPDEEANLVRVIDLEGKNLNDIGTTGGRVEMESRENHLVINSENTNRAWVIDGEHKITELQKAPKDVAGGNSPGGAPEASPSQTPSSSPSADNQRPKKPDPPSRPKPSPRPTQPPTVAPNAPVIARVLGNRDGSVTVEWYAPNANGGTLQSYDVRAATGASGGDRTFSGIRHVSGTSLQRMQIEPRAFVGDRDNYTFTVVARSTNGKVSKSSASSPITRYEP